MKLNREHSIRDSGFTLVETLVTLVVATIMMALIITSYWAQTRSSRDKQMIVEMQQNMRSAMFFLERDFKMAGYDDDFQDLASNTSVTTATATVFAFQSIDDTTGNIVTVTYSLADHLGDGDLDLQKQIDAGTPMPIAQNIEAIEFFYTLRDGTQSTTPAAADLDEIRSIGVSVLARGNTTSFADESTISFTTLSGAVWGPFNDGIRRQIITTTVNCRNMYSNT